MSNPYDEFPYRSAPIEWSAPERLALSSLLHGGPRAKLARYRVLELGCGDGSNLLPLAYYRRDARFVGIDGSVAAITRAEARRAALGLTNLKFVHADFLAADRALEGEFEFILAHGVFSWIPERTREALLALCARCLQKLGLLYLNYNTFPGWSVRGLVREFLQTRVGSSLGLEARAELAQTIAAQLAAALRAAPDHPYTKLMAREFSFVADGDRSYVAHEFLAPENRAFWRSEFLALAARYGFAHVADADFNRDSGRVSSELVQQIDAAGFGGEGACDLLDLVSYRQLHSPILTSDDWSPHTPDSEELDALYVAATLCASESRPVANEKLMLRHPSGFEVEVRDEMMRRALAELAAIWPRGKSIASLFGRGSPLVSDLRLLHAHGLVELRLVEPDPELPASTFLNQHELAWTGYATTRYHVPFTP